MIAPERTSNAMNARRLDCTSLFPLNSLLL
jgi:hypothetical protein